MSLYLSLMYLRLLLQLVTTMFAFEGSLTPSSSGNFKRFSVFVVVFFLFFFLSPIFRNESVVSSIATNRIEPHVYKCNWKSSRLTIVRLEFRLYLFLGSTSARLYVFRRFTLCITSKNGYSNEPIYRKNNVSGPREKYQAIGHARTR